MAKSVLSVNHQGLRDWIIQRLTAIVIGLYVLLGVGYSVKYSPLTYVTWHHLFSMPLVKTSTILFIVAVMWHAWIGIWTITTDYIKCFALRAALHSVVLGLLIAYFIFALLLFWNI